MTLAELKDSIAWEGKLQGDTSNIAQLNSIIQDSMIFIAQTHPELLLSDPVEYDLELENPTPFVAALGIDRVQIRTGELEPFDIPHEDQVIGPRIFSGWPKYYTIEGNAATSAADPKGLRVRLVPVLSDPNAEALIVTYKRVPLLTNDSHVVPDAWIPYLKKEVLKRVATHRAKGELEVAKMYGADAAQAIQAHTSTDSESEAASN